MAFAIRPLVLLMLGLTACSEEVVLGQFLERGDGGSSVDGGDNTDGGAIGGTAGGASGGGSAGGSTTAGGTGGSTAGGSATAGGAAGGGSAGAGGGPGGGGTAGGASDGGLGDAGPDLSVSLVGPLIVVADAGAQTWQLRVANSGTVDVSRPSVRLQVRPAALFSGCDDAGVVLIDGGMEITCLTADALAGGVSTASFALDLGTTLRFTDLAADVLPVTGELDASNNGATHAVAVAQVGLVPVSVFPPDPRLVDVTICVGTFITSYAECVPGSRIGYQFLLRGDGGWGLADAGVRAAWFSDNQGRNITFLNPTSPWTTGYIGASVSASCFEGVIQNGAGRPYGGAFRACLQ